MTWLVAIVLALLASSAAGGGPRGGASTPGPDGLIHLGYGVTLRYSAPSATTAPARGAGFGRGNPVAAEKAAKQAAGGWVVKDNPFNLSSVAIGHLSIGHVGGVLPFGDDRHFNPEWAKALTPDNFLASQPTKYRPEGKTNDLSEPWAIWWLLGAEAKVSGLPELSPSEVFGVGAALPHDFTVGALFKSAASAFKQVKSSPVGQAALQAEPS